MDIILVIAGFGALVVGGDILLKSAIALSLQFRIPKIIIGMTVISFATSLPELIVSIRSALQGSPDLALGNVVGSNIANLGLVLGITIMFTTIRVSHSFYRADWPMMFIASILFYVFILDGIVKQIEGIILLVCLILMLFYLFKFQQQAVEVEIDESLKKISTFKMIFYFVAGASLLALGSKWLVDGSVSIARSFNVSERIIGLTMVSIGTSVPELAASLIAVFKKENAMSIGNLLGSNLFNILAVVGITSIINPLQVIDQRMIEVDIYVFLFIAFLIFPLVFLPKRMQLGWQEGIVLLTSYFIFLYLTF